MGRTRAPWKPARHGVRDNAAGLCVKTVIHYYTRMYQSIARAKIWEQSHFSFQYKMYQKSAPGFFGVRYSGSGYHNATDL
jgi:hypothetical protein